ncbi:SDR family oxidoreductase [Rhodococcoides yunnanense]|uniref:SDR family oxidoreductase n=1 Tax=Rhodococcoides yunnanense TaxID=278209 RepID=UPI000932EFBD|nr:SDR family oxidoreductase [Rhodococcus yunnanensis]
MKGLAVVVGASSGIGAEISRSLAEHYSVILVARREEELEKIADDVGGTYLAVDITSADGVRGLAETLRERGLSPELVVYSAGVLRADPVTDMAIEDWDDILSVNLRGAFLVARELVPLMTAGGRLVLLSSVAAMKGRRALAAYAASKAGLERFAESLATELEPQGIAVNVVAPGPTRTAMIDRPDAPSVQLDPRRVADVVSWLSRLPLDVVIRKIEVQAPVSGPFAGGYEPGSSYRALEGDDRVAASTSQRSPLV